MSLATAERRRLALILGIAILVHTAEEWLMLGRMPFTLAQLQDASPLPLPLPSIAAVRAGLVGFAAFPAVVLWRWAAAPTVRLSFLVCMIAAMTASNALVPHIALAAIQGAYVPGLISAVTLTLPAGATVLAQAGSRRWVGRPVLVGGAVTGVLLLPAVLFGFWALGELLAALAAG
ncbi:HXXEE domain-containing protein [Erythrobacteraceae bacterium CFH 75059]|uniref:HXXEE domain-containing protein n=1 Tax=Qipengyuania thermophila TaxID=2509361 RepID=UPI00101FF708|nr:HXXEE domain-containing protein [Qipengyuania thermophila]TCD06506.1 HXXEE domain-containing protein [Erythrobacteraceae bacterium CFH 75059]